MDPALQQLVETHAPYLSVGEGGRILCSLNGHQFPPRLELVQSFVSGAKYKKLVARAEAEAALPKYEPFLVPSLNFPDKLFCALTNQVISRSMEAVKQHMRGKRFQRAKDRFQNDEQELFEEPNLGDAMEEDGAEGEEDGPGICVPEGVESESEDEDREGGSSMSDGEAEDGGEAAAGAGGSDSDGVVGDQGMAAAEPEERPRKKAGRGGKAATAAAAPAAAAAAAPQKGWQRGASKGEGSKKAAAAAGKAAPAKRGKAANGAAAAVAAANGAASSKAAKAKPAGRPSKAKKARTAK